LAEKLGVATERLWEALLVQAKISAFGYLALYIGIVVALVVIWRIFEAKEVELQQKVLKWIEDGTYSRFDINDFKMYRTGLKIIHAVVICIAVVIVAATFTTMLAGFFNADYWALQKVLNALGGHR